MTDVTDWRTANESATIGVVEAIARTELARSEEDVCPECGEPFNDVDMSYGGDMVFFHEDQDRPNCSVETEVTVER